ncbi:ribonuclease H-like domain-containing protein, partial [Rhodocollybia butyracea]
NCEAQVKGFPGAKYQKFPTEQAAKDFLGMTDPSGSSSIQTGTAQTIDISNRTNPIESIPSKGKKRSHNDMEVYNSISETSESTEPLVVYSDGACKGNGKVGSIAGIGVWWGNNDPRNLAERCPGDQTNNRAELIAICRVLETTPYRKGPLTIKTDSKYCIQCFNDWLPRWQQNGWRRADGKPVLNAPLIRYIAALLDARFRIGQKVFLEYIKGHAGFEGNEGADGLANVG